MEPIIERIEKADWASLREQLNSKGYAVLPGILKNEECAALISQYNDEQLFRKTVVMERYRFGLGQYKYYNYPLPTLIQNIRESVYPKLVPVANNWMKVLNNATVYPNSLHQLQAQCHVVAQNKPTVLLLKYGQGGHNTLHQDMYGDVFFPMQMVLFLNEPGIDYTGGQFVLTEQTPRAQSKAMVLTPGKGDALLFTTNFRPVKGSKGYYRVNIKHGVSEVHTGARHTLGIIFHDALS